MEKRTFKQAVISSILFIFIALVALATYLTVHENPSCSDGILNQGEVAADCGGPCPPCEFQTIKPLKNDWAKFFLIENKVYDAIALVENENPNYGLGEISYTFSFYDAANRLVGKREGKTFVLPNQKKYITEARISVVAEATKIELNLGKTDWKKLTEFQGAGLLIRNKRFESGDSGNNLGKARALGVIKNTSPYDWARVPVTVVLFGQDRQIIGVGSTEIYSLLSGEEREFVVSWFNEFKQPVQDSEMVADTNVFSDDNFMKRYGAGEKFQEF